MKLHTESQSFSCKLFSVIRSFWSTSIAVELEYRLNIFIEIISVIGNLAGSLFLLSIFYQSGSNLGGWSYYESVIVLGVYMLLEGFTNSFLIPNLSRIVRHVQNGTLDFVLLKPIDPQLWLSLRFFSPWGLPSFVVGLGLILLGLINSGSIITISTVLISITLLISSILILYSLWFLLATTSIWFVKVWNSTEVLRSVLVAGRYPISAFPAGMRTIFTFIIPIAFLTTIPAEVMLGRSSNYLLLVSILVTSIFFFISRKFWKFALKYYTSASS